MMSCGRIAALVVEAARWALLTESLRWAARGHDFLRTWTRAAQDLPKDEFRHGIHILKQKENVREVYALQALDISSHS